MYSGTRGPGTFEITTFTGRAKRVLSRVAVRIARANTAGGGNWAKSVRAPAGTASKRSLAPTMASCTRFALPVNVVISNVPGPRVPLYTAGARLLHYYPVSTIVDGQGLNITVQSYLDTLDFGLVACRELVPDLWDVVGAIVDDLEGLAKAAGVDPR